MDLLELKKRMHETGDLLRDNPELTVQEDNIMMLIESIIEYLLTVEKCKRRGKS